MKNQADEGLGPQPKAGDSSRRSWLCRSASAPSKQACEPVQDRCSFLVWPSLSPFLTLERVIAGSRDPARRNLPWLGSNSAGAAVQSISRDMPVFVTASN